MPLNPNGASASLEGCLTKLLHPSLVLLSAGGVGVERGPKGI